MKQKVLDFLAKRATAQIFIPQFSFEWSLSKEMQTVYHLKEARINRGDLKGKLEGAYLYPFGYESL
jgi:hypothetical protein